MRERGGRRWAWQIRFLPPDDDPYYLTIGAKSQVGAAERARDHIERRGKGDIPFEIVGKRPDGQRGHWGT